MHLKRYYDLLELDEHATYTDLKKNYRRIIKNYHPDLLKIENNKAQELNQAYEQLKKIFIEKKKKQYSSEILLLIGYLKLYLKKYSKKLKLRKSLHKDSAEIINRLLQINNKIRKYAAEMNDDDLYKINDFINNILIFDRLPYDVKVKTNSDRKVYFLYHEFYDHIIRLFELTFSRLDSIKKKNYLWQHYIESSLSKLDKLKEYDLTKNDLNLDFMYDFLDNLDFMILYLKESKTVINYKEFYNIFKN